MEFGHRHLLGIEPLRPDEIRMLLDRAESHVDLNRQRQKRSDTLSGLTQINMFFENSTRTENLLKWPDGVWAPTSSICR